MKTKKIKTTPYFMINKDINTIDITLMYTYKFNQEDLFKLDIIKLFLTNYSKNLTNEKEFKKALSKNLIISYSFSHSRVNDILFLRFDVTIPVEGIIPGYQIENALKLISDIIYHPYATTTSFNKEKFDREKDLLENKLNNSLLNVYNNGYYQLLDVLDEENNYYIGYEKACNYLKKTTSKDSYTLYKKAVLENDFICYVYGNANKKELTNLINKYFKCHNKEVIFNLNYNKFYQAREYKYYERNFDFNQTLLYMVYDVKDMRDEDLEYLTLIANILGGDENDLILKKLRLENDLVYFCNVNKYVYNGLFVIETSLNYENKDLAIKLIKEIIQSLKNKRFLKKCIERLLKGIELDILVDDDKKYAKIENKIDYDLSLRTNKSINDAYKSMNINDIITFLDRLNLDTILVLKGEEK